MGPDASNAVPALITALENPYLRPEALTALGKIGPTAARAIPNLKSLLHDPDNYLRGQAAAALLRIDSDVDTALPILLQALPSANMYSKRDWIIALGEMGPRARPAVPALVRELNGPNKWSHKDIANALQQIEPEWDGKPGFPGKEDLIVDYSLGNLEESDFGQDLRANNLTNANSQVAHVGVK